MLQQMMIEPNLQKIKKTFHDQKKNKKMIHHFETTKYEQMLKWIQKNHQQNDEI